MRQDNFIIIRSVHWLTEGKKLKYMDVKDLQQVDGIWVATEIVMTTKKGKKLQHKTQLKLNNIKFNQALEEDLFTVRRLAKGS